MTQHKEFVTFSNVHKDDFKCVCGNTQMSDGAFPCRLDGTLVEPTPDEWPQDLYRCERCHRVFDGDTGEFKGQERDTQNPK